MHVLAIWLVAKSVPGSGALERFTRDTGRANPDRVHSLLQAPAHSLLSYIAIRPSIAGAGAVLCCIALPCAHALGPVALFFVALGADLSVHSC